LWAEFGRAKAPVKLFLPDSKFDTLSLTPRMAFQK
jgi:hypothetical protein